ncbi:MAG TPA: N-acetylglucosamine-6-phosphate deacetylase [Blastocatellia bacterium]|nr:N-acetylglucosamine-6-phosphate deacetylase [Blastocatellia bacterium]HMX24886.1 N-acetylglucosamine-6-phosphate deacetylase [Blastocatellia bacterium]HMZ20022.1 N-acetylglucosamine-6-phosphate deacetylase [Blastocatellia bacterium]HNG32812.1 N-acetylglucosamine-6-phosphate deacetylase [Blastocatellia bacterium]
MTNRLAIIGGKIVTPQTIIENGTVLCEDGKVQFVGSARDAQPEPGSQIIDATGGVVMPGFIDTHFHGSGGDDVMANGSEGIRRISRALLKFGTTGYLATTIAARHDELMKAIEDTRAAEAADNHTPEAAEVLGLHIEGPYINLKFKGAQPIAGIRDPNFDECRELFAAADGRIKIMTMAPELPGAVELIRFLKANGAEASLGHSEADYDTALAAIDAGATRATHLYNAMSGVHHRKPGLASACLNEPGIQAELICDGVHVHPRMAQLAWHAKGREGLTLITDATAAQGVGDGRFTLGDFQIEVRGPLCTLLDGVTIAGSVLTMNAAVGNAMAFTGMSLIDAAHTASLAPARVCGVADRKGSIEIGKDADLAILNADFSVSHTVRAGQVAWQS